MAAPGTGPSAAARTVGRPPDPATSAPTRRSPAGACHEPAAGGGETHQPRGRPDPGEDGRTVVDPGGYMLRFTRFYPAKVAKAADAGHAAEPAGEPPA